MYTKIEIPEFLQKNDVHFYQETEEKQELYFKVIVQKSTKFKIEDISNLVGAIKNRKKEYIQEIKREVDCVTYQGDKFYFLSGVI